MAAWLQLWSYRRVRERPQTNRKSPSARQARQGLRRQRRRTKHVLSNGRVTTNEARAETKHHDRCRTVQNTVTNTTTDHMIGTKTTITPTSLTTNETTHATTPILTTTATKAVTTTITRTRHLAQTTTKTLVNRKPQPGCQDSHQQAKQRMARPNTNPTQGNGPHTNTGHTARRPKGVRHQCTNSARGNRHS